MTHTTTEAREHFSEIINQVAFGKERQILIRHGKELVAIIPIEDLRYLEKLEDARDLEEARTELRRAKDQPKESWEDVKKELGL